MQWQGKILVLPVEQFDEEDDGRCDHFLRMGAARVPVLRDDLEGRHFALLPVGFDPDRQAITITDVDAD